MGVLNAKFEWETKPTSFRPATQYGVINDTAIIEEILRVEVLRCQNQGGYQEFGASSSSWRPEFQNTNTMGEKACGALTCRAAGRLLCTILV